MDTDVGYCTDSSHGSKSRAAVAVGSPEVVQPEDAAKEVEHETHRSTALHVEKRKK